MEYGTVWRYLDISISLNHTLERKINGIEGQYWSGWSNHRKPPLLSSITSRTFGQVTSLYRFCQSAPAMNINNGNIALSIMCIKTTANRHTSASHKCLITKTKVLYCYLPLESSRRTAGGRGRSHCSCPAGGRGSGSPSSVQHWSPSPSPAGPPTPTAGTWAGGGGGHVDQ